MHRYLHLAVTPPGSDALALRKALQDALLSTCGLSSSLYLDVLWVAQSGLEAVVRVNQSDATKVQASIAASSSSPRMSLIRESSFLPALLLDGTEL